MVFLIIQVHIEHKVLDADESVPASHTSTSRIQICSTLERFK